FDEVDLEPPAEPGGVTDIREERLADLRRHVGRLPHALREAVLLFYFEERSHAEIAAVLGVTEAAVNQRLHRARQSLKQAFDQAAAEGPGPAPCAMPCDRSPAPRWRTRRASSRPCRRAVLRRHSTPGCRGRCSASASRWAPAPTPC